ncbi:alanine dehydrogenase [Pseudoteredinibacter isoporae]|uniref:alanine dehydrogenase n=1 Tax=Pseudoteredinibacter isoporae TaxID=570281 RepID=UPI0031020287
MSAQFPAFQSIALVKEIESPENPGGLEKRVALIPEDVAKLVAAGCQVFVERGAGDGVGFSDQEYLDEGALMQSAEEIYENKDLIIKFKGPSLESIKQMRPGTTLFCMAHFHSYPDRAQLLADQQINVIAMEEILESPKRQSDASIIGRTAMNKALSPYMADNSIGSLNVKVLGWSECLGAAVRRAGNRDPRSLQLLNADIATADLELSRNNSLYVYDSRILQRQGLIASLQKAGEGVLDLAEYEREYGAQAVADYRESHPPREFGLRRIQCLHETGMAGARYGLKLLAENKPELDIKDAKVAVLGYGNVGQGAIHELHDQGVKTIHVLGRTHTSKGRIDYWLNDIDLVVNGAEQPPHLRGINFLVSNSHLKHLVPDGSVVIDLVGGSPTNRSPVEAVESCTFLTDPHFERDGVTVSSLWGWPMMGMMRETAIRYSGQIADVLLGTEQLYKGLSALAPGVERALVCGPFPSEA